MRNFRIITTPAVRSKWMPKIFAALRNRARIPLFKTVLNRKYSLRREATSRYAAFMSQRPVRHAIHDCQHAAIHAKPVWNLAIVARRRRRPGRRLSGFDAAFAVRQSQRPRSVDRGRGDRFRRRHLHVRAGQRHRHRHAQRRRRAGIVVRGQRHRARPLQSTGAHRDIAPAQENNLLPAPKSRPCRFRASAGRSASFT